MKLLTFISLCFFIIQVTCKSFDLENVVPQAINQILKHYFAQNSPKVDLIFFGRLEKSVKIIEFLMRKNKEQISFQVIDGNRFGSQQISLNSSSILLFESSENFARSFETISWQDDYNDELKNDLVYFPKGLETDLDFIRAHFSYVKNNNYNNKTDLGAVIFSNDKVKITMIAQIPKK